MRAPRNPRLGWLGVAGTMGALALLGLALQGDPFRLWPVVHLAPVETRAHAVAAGVALAGAILPPSWGARAGRGGGILLLAAAGVAALSPSLLGFAPQAGAILEPSQATAYALSGAWLWACSKAS